MRVEYIEVSVVVQIDGDSVDDLLRVQTLRDELKEHGPSKTRKVKRPKDWPEKAAK